MALLRMYALHLVGGGMDFACGDCLHEAIRERRDQEGLVSTARVDPSEPCSWCGGDGRG